MYDEGPSPLVSISRYAVTERNWGNIRQCWLAASSRVKNKGLDESLWRETDNLLFTTMTLNPQPLHLDAEFASHTPHGQILVNSIFTLGLVVGLSVGDTTLGTTLGNLGFDKTTFPHPVFIGDTIRAYSEVVDRRISRTKPDRGIVTFEHRGMNQRGELVCACQRGAMMMRRPAA